MRLECQRLPHFHTRILVEERGGRVIEGVDKANGLRLSILNGTDAGEEEEREGGLNRWYSNIPNLTTTYATTMYTHTSSENTFNVSKVAVSRGGAGGPGRFSMIDRPGKCVW